MTFNITALIIASAFAGLLGSHFDNLNGTHHLPVPGAQVVTSQAR